MSADDGFELLYVCTGNICRSPVAALLLAHRLQERLGDEAAHFRVLSAGTHGLDGWPIEPTAGSSLTPYSIDVTTHRGRRLVAAHIESAQLVLTATREQRSSVVALVPKAAERTFTMREFARLAGDAAPPRDPGAGPVDRARDLVSAAAARRGYTWVPPEQDDIDDPYGERPEVYQRVTEDIAATLDAFLVPVTGPAPEGRS